MKRLLSIAACLATVLTGCMSAEEQAAANRIITALPTEVEGCTFIADVDNSGPYSTVHMARFNLKHQAAQMGATHLVEKYAYTSHITFKLLGVVLSGRAYKCPAGKGPILDNEKGKLQYDFPMTDPEQDIIND
ncbi:hypothetical protein SAMN02910357_00432 [Succinivibrio dextrinosolvens]|uniref:hypothetical protein n=1 Tax=Succinivibrio dextrinosolvens TaxID=83771 RepID=UPI0008E83E84|nr:hypothetical protein [Succinivibrio dextrinosolvens]SFS38172.1 hypothetical protein SAMN02910357_00432 [Succinivibrio dextrinosolvens]